MTDKEQIIIDGVDVSKCKYYALQKHYDIESDGLWKVCYSKDCKYSICANNYDCYYKQFKRKEQECKKLNNKIIDMNSIIEDAAINLGNKNLSTLYDLPFEIKKLIQECKALKSESFTREELIGIQEKDIARYRKALEEIEKVINNILNSCLGRNTVSCRPAHNVCGDLINILDIINKAKDSE